MTTFKINRRPTKYKEILDSIIEQGHALKSLHNPQTWRLSALIFAIRLNDCRMLFEELNNRWQKQLPFSEAWDVDFAIWKNKIWTLVNDIKNYASNESFDEWQQLCDADIKDFIVKASDCLKGNVPISEVVDFLKDKETDLSTVILNMGHSLSAILVEIDEIPLSATKRQFVSYFDRLMKIYMNENSNNPYPIKVKDGVLTFEKWIASKTEKQRIISIQNRLNTIHSSMQKDEVWCEVWEENVIFEQHTIDKEGIGRAIFPMRRGVIGSENIACSKSLYNFFSSIALCERLWEYEKQQNTNALNNLSNSRRELLNELEAWIEKGDWVEPATKENIIGFMRQLLGVGSKKLFGDEAKMSTVVWEQLETGGADSPRVFFQKMIGYLSFHKLLPERLGDDKLNKSFFGQKATTYQNIGHGRPGDKSMPRKFSEIIPLLDAYRPK